MRNRKLIFTALLALLAVTFNACLDDPEPAALNVVTDVYVQKIVQDGEEKYGLSFWVFGNKEIQTATVDGPGDETWTLNQDENNSYVFNLFPETEQYTDSMPRSGNYTFTVTSTQSDEVPATSTDVLENNELDAILIDSIEYSDSKLKTEWAVVENADAYVVRLYNESDALIYVSPAIAGNKNNHSFGTTDPGWTNAGKKAETGKTYRLELLAILFESTSLPTNREYNIQFISVASAEIVWGE